MHIFVYKTLGNQLLNSNMRNANEQLHSQGHVWHHAWRLLRMQSMTKAMLVTFNQQHLPSH